MANSYYSGGNSPRNYSFDMENSNRQVNGAIVTKMQEQCGHTPEAYGNKAAPLLAQLAGGIVGSINNFEYPDQYQKSDLDPELANKRIKLINQVQTYNNIARQEQLNAQRQVSKADLEELNILLNAPSGTASVQDIDNNKNSFSIKETGTSLLNSYIDEKNNNVNQFNLPLFAENGGGLTIADREFIREEFKSLQKSIIELREIILAQQNIIDKFQAYITINSESEETQTEASELDIKEEAYEEQTEEFLTFDNE